MLEALNFVDGAWSDLGRAARFTSHDPATGEVLGEVVDSDPQDAERAIAAARRAFDATIWSHEPRRRSRVLLEMAARLEAQAESIIRLLTLENGKLLAESRIEVTNAISMCYYNAGLARNLFGRTAEIEPDVFAFLPREAAGVAGIIVPWNAPIGLLFRALAAALAAGCTIVIKAAPQTALTTAAALRIALDDPTLAAGVVNLINERGSAAAEALVASPQVDVLSYTGSTQIGKRIMAAAASTLKRVNLELGGCNPAIIGRDVDLRQAVPAITRAGLIFAGQQCVAATRVLVHRSRFDAALEAFCAAVSGTVVGAGGDPRSQMGPLIDVRSRDRVQALIRAAAARNEILIEGQVPAGSPPGSSLLGPSLVRILDRGSPICAEEIFGPVITLDAFDDDGEALAIANGTRYGLAASVWSTDGLWANRLARRIRAGTVWINCHGRFFPEIEVGGFKESGIGQLFGQQGLDDFLQTKHICWPTPPA